LFFDSIAYAMGAGGAEGGQPGGFQALIPLVLMFVIFYFLLIRPQQKKVKKHREMLSSLKKGDQILTSGGIYGKIVGLTDTIATVEIADKVRVKVSRANIGDLVQTVQGGNQEQ
jgi:preprotein translocase subunit YajC